MYKNLLDKYRREFKFKLYAWALMPQHLHLLIDTGPECEISDIMRCLNTAYPKYFNNRYNRRGHLFRERFKTCMVEEKEYLTTAISHIHRNPVRLGLAVYPYEYPHSSAPFYETLQSDYPELDEAKTFLQEHLKTTSFSQQEELQAVLHKKLTRGGILGSKEFVALVRKKIAKAKQDALTENLPKPAFPWRIVMLIVVISFAIGVLMFRVFMPKLYKGRISGEPVKVVPLAQKAGLELTEWVLQFNEPNSQEVSFSDKITFMNDKVYSAKFSSQGFLPSRYSVVEENGVLIWETMQTKTGENVSWRGRVNGTTMQGVLSLRLLDSKEQVFSFQSIKHRRKRR